MFADITVGGVITGLLVAGVCTLIANGFKQYRLWQIRDDIATLQFERKHLEEIKKSSVAMNRNGFRAIFLIFICIGLAQFFQILMEFLHLPHGLKEGIASGLWLGVVMASFVCFRRYKNLANYREAIEDIDAKLNKLLEKEQKL